MVNQSRFRMSKYEGEEITINNEIDIEVDEALKNGRIQRKLN